MTPVEHNQALVKELLETVEQYQGGLLMDIEILAKALILGERRIEPLETDIDPNTGLSHRRG